MSMSFDDPLNKKQQEIMKKMFGDELVANDEKTALLQGREFMQKKMSTLANELKQPVKLEMNSIGDTKTVNGVEYFLTVDGWKPNPNPIKP